jgi:putative lipoprotein
LEKLPDGLQLNLKMLDVSDPAAVPETVAERTIPAPRQLPYNFELGYDPARIDAEGRYVIEASLQADGLSLYGTTAATPVLTQGAPDRGFSLNLVQGGKAVATMAPADQLKADFTALVANIGALRRITGERLEEETAVGWDAFVAADGQVRMAREQVDYAEAGNAAFRYAYQGGQPWVVERKQGRVITMIGWTSDGTLLLNEKGSESASEDEVAALRKRALDLYATAAARR